jgi:hypothetical protein
MKIFAITFASLLPVVAIDPLAAQSPDQLVGKNVSIAQSNYRGRSAIQVIAKPEAANATSYALIKNASFRDGVIEVDLAGQPAAGAPAALAGLLASLFGSRPTDATSTFISDPRTVGPMIKSGGITPPNTVRIPILTLPAPGRRLPKNASRMSI